MTRSYNFTDGVTLLCYRQPVGSHHHLRLCESVDFGRPVEHSYTCCDRWRYRCLMSCMWKSNAKIIINTCLVFAENHQQFCHKLRSIGPYKPVQNVWYATELSAVYWLLDIFVTFTVYLLGAYRTKTNYYFLRTFFRCALSYRAATTARRPLAFHARHAPTMNGVRPKPSGKSSRGEYSP